MSTLRLSRLLLPIVVAASVLTACSAPASSGSGGDTLASDGAQASEQADAGASGEDAPASGEKFGCTDGMLTYLADHGYADVPPVDPATFTFPDDVGLAATPACLVSEDDGMGAIRSSAIFTDDPAGAFSQAADAFAAAGWQGSVSDVSGGLWWSDGADVSEAQYSVGGAQLDIDGQNVAWFTWGY